MKKFLKRLLGIEELEKKVNELEEKLEKSQTFTKKESNDGEQFIAIFDEWLNGARKEGADE